MIYNCKCTPSLGTILPHWVQCFLYLIPNNKLRRWRAERASYLVELHKGDPDYYPRDWVFHTWNELYWHWTSQWRVQDESFCRMLGTKSPRSGTLRV